MLFSKNEIRDALQELVERAIDAGLEGTICLVGGAAIELIIGERGATRDIDSFMYRDGVFSEVINEIATTRGWPQSWLNSQARMFASDYDDPLTWNVLIEKNGVTIRIAPAEVLVAMKLRAARGFRDFDDVELLLAHLEWGAGEARQSFERLYPHDVLNARAESFLASRAD